MTLTFSKRRSFIHQDREYVLRRDVIETKKVTFLDEEIIRRETLFC